MVSRVFQKSGGGKKARVSLAGSHYSESAGVPPSISSLPPLFDSSPYGAAAAAGDRDSCSYESTEREPVPCFSTVAAATATAAAGLTHNHLPPPPAMAHYGRGPAVGGAGSVFPSLRSLQDSLHLPFFLSTLAPPVGGSAAGMACDAAVHHRGEEMGGNGWPSDLDRKAEVAGRAHPMAVGSTELDYCLWTF